MGSFFTNIHLKNDSQEDISSAIRKTLQNLGASEISVGKSEHPGKTIKQYGFYITPPSQRWVSVYGNDWDLMNELGPPLSKELETDALFLYLHDSDVWFYTFYAKGKYIDAFNSWPEYFKAAPEPISLRNAELLKPVMVPSVSAEKVYEILERSRCHSGSEEEDCEALFAEFAECFDITSANTDYTYLKQESDLVGPLAEINFIGPANLAKRLRELIRS